MSDLNLMDYGRNSPHKVMGGGMGVGSENPVAGFMQGYSFVDNLKRQNAADARANADDDLKRQLLQGQVDSMNDQKQVNSNYAVMSAMTHDPSGWWNNVDDDTLQKTLSGLSNHPVYGYLATHEGRNQFKTGYNKIMASMPNQQNRGIFDLQGIADGLNQALWPQIKQGTGENGRTDVTGKKISAVIPDANNPGRFHFEVTTTYGDGSSSVGPITANRTGLPDDKVRTYSIEDVLDPLRRNASIVNYLDSQNARLGDQAALSRITAQARGKDVTDQLDLIDKKLSPEDKQRQAIRIGLQGGLGVNESATLGANWGKQPKDKGFEDASKATQVFNQNIGYLYDNPANAAALAHKLGDSNPVLSNQLRNLSQIQDKGQYNAAVDNLRTKAESPSQRVSKDKGLEDASKATQVFNQNVGYLYDNPANAAALADKLGDSNPVLSNQLRNLSQIQDKGQYNAAVDNLRTKAESPYQRVTQENTPRPSGQGVSVTSMQGQPKGYYSVYGVVKWWDGKQFR